MKRASAVKCITALAVATGVAVVRAEPWTCKSHEDQITGERRANALFIPKTSDAGVIAGLAMIDVADVSEGFSLVVRAKTGLVDCGRGQRCALRVRLDGEPTTFIAEGLGRGAMLIRGYEAARIDAARLMRIEVPMYNRGPVYFDFAFDRSARLTCGQAGASEDAASGAN